MRLLTLIGVAWLVATSPAQAQKATFREPEVKAVFLFNFAQFVEWPLEAFPDPKAALVIGVLGDDPFGRVLDDVISGEVVRGRRLVVERFRRVEDITLCHILFVSRSEADRVPQILTALEGRPILTVGDTEGFSSGGGVIRFLTEQNRIRLRVNVGAAKAAGLTISSNLLRPAEIIGAGKTP